MVPLKPGALTAERGSKDVELFAIGFIGDEVAPFVAIARADALSLASVIAAVLPRPDRQAIHVDAHFRAALAHGTGTALSGTRFLPRASG